MPTGFAVAKAAILFLLGTFENHIFCCCLPFARMAGINLRQHTIQSFPITFCPLIRTAPISVDGDSKIAILNLFSHRINVFFFTHST